jgi:hypothetical protein
MESIELEAKMFIDPKICLDFYLKKASELDIEILKKIEGMTSWGEFQNLITVCVNKKDCITSLEGGLMDTMITILRLFLAYKDINIEIINIVLSIIANSIEEYEEIPGEENPSNKLIVSRSSIKRLFSIGGIKTLHEVIIYITSIYNIENIQCTRCILYYSRHLEYMRELHDAHNIYNVYNEFNGNKILTATILKKYKDLNSQFSTELAKNILNMINTI